MIIQIYEITSVNEALNVASLGVNNIGVVVGDGKYASEIRPYKAREIFLSLPQDKKGVILTFSNDLEQIEKITKDCEPDIIHIAADLEAVMPGDIETLKKKHPKVEIMRTIPIIGEESVVASMMYDGIADYLFLDCKNLTHIIAGVTGKIHDWNISRKVVDSVQTKVILAGGLGPDSVEDAINTVRPYGVSSKTKTDKIGGHEKDLVKIKMFVEKAKSVNLKYI